MKLVYGILVGAKFGDRFLTRDGSLALYLWKNGKEGHSVQLETPKKPVHYDNDGRFYGSKEENENDIVYKLK